MAALSPVPGQQYFDSNGDPLAGGKLWTYQTGTTTPKAAYQDQAGSSAHANPIILDSAGRVQPALWITSDGEYRYRLLTSADVLVDEWDDVGVDESSLQTDLADSATVGKGDALIGVKRTTSGSVATTQHVVNEQREIFAKADAGCVADGVTDDRSALNNANTMAGTTATIWLPAGTYVIGSNLTLSASLRFSPGAKLKPSSGITLTISGSIQAGNWQIFDTSAGGTVVSAANTPREVTPYWFGAVGDFSSNDRGAVQAASTFAQSFGTLLVNGRFLCSTGITLPDFQTVKGIGWSLNYVVASTDPQLGTSMTSGVFITTGESCIFENVQITNTAGSWNSGTSTYSGTSCTGIQTVGNINCNGTKIRGFQYCVNLTDNAYYCRFKTTEFLESEIAIYSTTQAYNIDCIDIRSGSVSYFHNASSGANATTNLKVIGGSIEGFATAVDYVLCGAFFGTYFETGKASAYGFFSAQTLDNAQLSLFGCTIYMNNVTRFVNFSSRAEIGFVAHGNYISASAVSATGTVYYLPDSGSVSILGDACTATFNATYTTNQANWMQIHYPRGIGSDYVTFNGEIAGSATYDPANLADGAGATTTVTATGAALGDFVAGVSFSLDLQGITTTAWVSAANTVSVRFQNETGGAIDLGSGTLRVRVRKG